MLLLLLLLFVLEPLSKFLVKGGWPSHLANNHRETRIYFHGGHGFRVPFFLWENRILDVSMDANPYIHHENPSILGNLKRVGPGTRDPETNSEKST